jgi:hypothetical protein
VTRWRQSWQGACEHPCATLLVKGDTAAMPAKSEKQRKFMGAELARKRAGKKTKTGMSEKELEKYASKKKKS